MDSCQSDRCGATSFIAAGSLAKVTRASAGEQSPPLPISLSNSEYRGFDQVLLLCEHLVVCCATRIGAPRILLNSFSSMATCESFSRLRPPQGLVCLPAKLQCLSEAEP